MTRERPVGEGEVVSVPEDTAQIAKDVDAYSVVAASVVNDFVPVDHVLVEIVAGAAFKRCVSVRQEAIISGAAADDVIAHPAVEIIVAKITDDGIVSVVTPDKVVAREAINEVI
jgi:hypothetical protein